MARGGKRVGAGRKAGAASKKTRAIADKAAAAGITPLEVLLEAMHAAYDAEGAVAAVEYATLAAPYVHPRLQAVAASVSKASTFDEMLAEALGVKETKAHGRERSRTH